MSSSSSSPERATARLSAIPSTGWLRAADLPRRYPIFSPSAWKAFIRDNRLKTSKPEGSRCRVVNTDDVDAFLRGVSQAVAQ